MKEVQMAGRLYNGGCPVCGNEGLMRHIDRAEWFYCEQHKTCWNSSDNCISHHPDETAEERKQNAINNVKFFDEGGYTIVEPVYAKYKAAAKMKEMPPACEMKISLDVNRDEEGVDYMCPTVSPEMHREEFEYASGHIADYARSILSSWKDGEMFEQYQARSEKESDPFPF